VGTKQKEDAQTVEEDIGPAISSPGKRVALSATAPVATCFRSKCNSYSSNGEKVRMTSITKVAEAFFGACEAGKGWDTCRAYCTPDATFSAQAEPLLDVKTLAELRTG